MATHRKRLEAEALAASFLDDLTGLPRRNLLLDRLRHAMALAKRNSTSGAVLFLDLDGFQQINDFYGHRAGDAVLKVVAQRLQAAVRATDTVARMGGDEFVVLLPQVSDARDASAVGKKLLLAIEKPIRWGAHLLGVSVSVGVTHFAAAEDDASALLERADQAMYRAKLSCKRQVVEL